MAEVKEEFQSRYFKKNTDNGEKETKRCKIIYTDTNTTAYSFENDSQIWVYYGNKDGEGTQENPIIDGDQLVKLTVKKIGRDEFMYVDFINTHVAKEGVVSLKLGEIITIIKSITTIYGINKIMLQDDAHFYLDNSKNAVKALHLRALDQEKKIKLSIYQTVNFRPIKQDNIESCIISLRNVTCSDLYNASVKILDSLKNINYSTTSVYQINVQHTNLEVSYIPIKAHKLRLGPIFNRYRENLESLNSLLIEHKNSIRNIYELCKIEKNCKDESIYKKSRDFLSCLENDVNMNVIIVEGKDSEKSPNATDCDVNKTVDTVTKNPINITKIFNLFYGTFKKLDYLYNEMEMTLESSE